MISNEQKKTVRQGLEFVRDFVSSLTFSGYDNACRVKAAHECISCAIDIISEECACENKEATEISGDGEK